MYLPPNSNNHYPCIEANSYEGKLYRKATDIRASRMINKPPEIPKNH